MRIWQLQFEVDKYDNLIPVKEFSADELQSFDGRNKKEHWKPLAVKRMEPEKKLELGDAPGFMIPAFSKRAVEILHPLMCNSVEELELDFHEEEFWGINVVAVLDVIDYSKSKYKTYSDGKRIMLFEKYVFKICDDIIEHNIFKIAEERRRRAFVTEKFKQAVEENHLTGFKFKLVWDSENELE